MQLFCDPTAATYDQNFLTIFVKISDNLENKNQLGSQLIKTSTNL